MLNLNLKNNNLVTFTNSTKTQPMAQTSTLGPYCVSPTKSSGALYQRVAT